MQREISLRGRAYPTDLNPSGTVFGGWIMAKMDKAASIAVENIVLSNTVTVKVSDLHFIQPIKNGDIVTIYTTLKKIGVASLTVNVDVQVKHRISNKEYAVSNADFSFVTLDDNMKPIPVLDVIRDNAPQEAVNLARMCSITPCDNIYHDND
jgi:acyl-CoA thioesterase YciA